MLTEVWTDEWDKVDLDNILCCRGQKHNDCKTALLKYSYLNVLIGLVMHQRAVS